MHRPLFFLSAPVRGALALFVALLAMPIGTAGAQTAEPAQPAPLANPAPAPDEAWWTGPVAASSPETLPRGHLLVEPYLFDVRAKGGDYLGSLTFILYGLADNLTVGAIPTFGAYHTHGSAHKRTLAVNDLTLTAQFRVHHAQPGELLPSVALVVQRVLPIGKFDRLAGNPDRGIGSGAPSILAGLYAQRIDRIGARPMRTRVNLSYSFAADTDVHGESIFGTPDGFRGVARVGGVALADLAFEYSLTRNWVVASDLIYRRARATRFDGYADAIRHTGTIAGRSTFSIAPAIEYNWSSTRGVLLGVRYTTKAGSAPESVTPVVAFNAIF